MRIIQAKEKDLTTPHKTKHTKTIVIFLPEKAHK